MFDIYWYDYDDCHNISELIIKAKTASRTEYVWLAHRSVDYSNFNWRWVPNYYQQHFYHAWPSHNNNECYTTWLIPIDFDFDFEKTQCVFHKDLLPVSTNPVWNTDDRIDYTNFDFSWFPSVWEWGYRHEFAMRGTEKLSYTSLLSHNKETKYHLANLYWKSDYKFDTY